MPKGVYARTPRLLGERFSTKVNRTGGPDACHLWTAYTMRNGYGTIGGTGSRKQLAHRVAWELKYGPVPPGLLVLHKCDNRRCVNERHLFLGTAAENTRDMVTKGRARGMRKPVTKRLIASIRRRITAGVSRARTARELGVSASLIRSVCAGVYT